MTEVRTEVNLKEEQWIEVQLKSTTEKLCTLYDYQTAGIDIRAIEC
jgi:hypothetical protein